MTTALRTDRPALVGDGPVEASACVDLEHYRPLSFDPNGYYRALGLSPTATRVEIREAYMARDGQSDPYLTYVVKMLLNDKTRAAYDAVPVGSVFMDRYVADRIIKARHSSWHQTDAVFHKGSWDHLSDVLDTLVEVAETGGNPEPWGFAHYRWDTDFDSTEALRLLQRELLILLGTREGALRFAVGYRGGITSAQVVRVGHRLVVFISPDAPVTPSVLAEALQQMLRELQPDPQGQ